VTPCLAGVTFLLRLSTTTMASTGAIGIFSVCSSGNVSIQVTCTGPSCTGLEDIPGVTCTNDIASLRCTNNVVCEGTSNLTSVFSIQQKNLTIFQNQKISIAGQEYSLIGTGPSFILANAAISWRFSRGYTLLKLLVCIFMMILAVQAAAQSPFSPIYSQFSEALGPLLGPLEHLVCEKGVGGATSGIAGKARGDLEMRLLQTCLNLVADAVLEGGEAELVVATGGVGEAVGGAVIGKVLPIAAPSNLLAAVVTSGALCLSLIQAIFDAVIGQASNDLCDALISSQTSAPLVNSPIIISSSTSSTTSTTIITSSHSPRRSSVPPSSIPSDFPSAAVLAGDQCVATQLSVYYIGVRGLAQSCGSSNSTGGAWDMSTIFCDPSIRPRYSTLCMELCNNPYGSYDLQALITYAGPAFNLSATLATISEVCQGFLGTGRCSSAGPSCACGVGSLTCVPSADGCTPA